MVLRSLKNDSGSITPFLFIIAAGLFSVFVITYTHFISLATKAEQKRYLEIASDDLLAGFDASLLKNYGILAYDSQGSLDHVERVLSYNLEANGQDPINALATYQPALTMANRQSVAETCIKIAQYQLPDEVVGELDQIYHFSDKVSNKVKGYEKVNKFATTLSDLQTVVEDYYNLVEDLNDLHGLKTKYFLEVDEERAIYKIVGLEKDYKKALRKIEKFETGLRQAERKYKDLKSATYDEALGEIVGQIDFNKDEYVHLFSEEGRDSLGQVKEALQNNVDLLEEIVDSSDFDAIEDLNRQMYVGGDDREESPWSQILDNKALEAKGQGYNWHDFFNKWEHELSMSENVALDFGQTLLLNEYILGSFQSKVATDVRNFDFLTRLDRDSLYSDGEVEYIIAGGRHPYTAVKIRIFAIRMGCNMTALYMDAENFKIAQSIGTAIGSWFPGGQLAGTVLVVTAWSGLESILDMEALCQGQGVPFIKSHKSWRTDIDINSRTITTKSPVSENQESPANEYYTSYYNDYLRMLLMLVSNDSKVQRCLEVIQENERAGRGGDFALDKMVFSHELQWQDFTVIGDYYE